jgi:hypothetical protein
VVLLRTTHDECKFKESESTKHPNVGKAPPKKQRNAKTNASQPRRKHTRLPPNRMSVSAIPVGSLDTYPMLAQTKPKLKPALRARFIKIKASWRFGKAHLPTPTNKNVPHVSSKRG